MDVQDASPLLERDLGEATLAADPGVVHEDRGGARPDSERSGDRRGDGGRIHDIGDEARSPAGPRRRGRPRPPTAGRRPGRGSRPRRRRRRAGGRSPGRSRRPRRSPGRPAPRGVDRSVGGRSGRSSCAEDSPGTATHAVVCGSFGRRAAVGIERGASGADGPPVDGAEPLAQGAPAEARLRPAGGPQLHARGAPRGRPGRRGGEPGGRGERRLHQARREPDGRHRGGCRGRRVPPDPRRERRPRARRRGLGQAHPARLRPRCRDRVRPLRRSRSSCGRARDVGLDRHGGERLRRRHDRLLRARPGRPRERRAVPPGLPPSDPGGRPAAAPAATGDPPGQGRLRRARDDRPADPARGRRLVPGHRLDLRPGGPRRVGHGSWPPPTTSP